VLHLTACPAQLLNAGVVRKTNNGLIELRLSVEQSFTGQLRAESGQVNFYRGGRYSGNMTAFTGGQLLFGGQNTNDQHFFLDDSVLQSQASVFVNNGVAHFMGTINITVFNFVVQGTGQAFIHRAANLIQLGSSIVCMGSGVLNWDKPDFLWQQVWHNESCTINSPVDIMVMGTYAWNGGTINMQGNA
jgi:hypothetical protein